MTVIDAGKYMNGKFAKVNTHIGDGSDTYLIPGLNGRQGDDGRRLYLQFYDGNFPHDLTGETVELQGKDAQGRTKTSVSLEHVYSAKAGTCSFLVPGPFYQAAGPYTNAYFVIKKADTGQAVSTIPVAMTVVENAVFMTTNESETYLDEYEGRLLKFQKLLDQWMEGSGGQIEGVQKLIGTAQNQAAELMKQIQDNHMAKLDGVNDFTGTNTFGTAHISNATLDNATIGSLSGAALQKIYNYVNQALNSAKGSFEDNMAGKVDTYQVRGVNGCTVQDAQCKVFHFNKHVGYGAITGGITLPPMKAWESRQVLEVDAAAMNGGQLAMPLLNAQNNTNVLYWQYLEGDSGKIWVDRQSNAFDGTKSDPEYIETGWWCVW